MITLSSELVLEGLSRKTEPAAGAEPLERGAELMTALTRWWADRVLAVFTQLPARDRLDSIEVTLPLLETPNTFVVRFNENLLSDLLQAYSTHGWSAFDVVDGRIRECGDEGLLTLRFVHLTRNVLAVLVASALQRVEQAASAFAKTRWASSRDMLESWRSEFFRPPSSASYVLFERTEVAPKLVELFRKFTSLREQVDYLQEKINERNKKAPPKERGVGAELWFEIYAAPQRELLPKMVELLEQIRLIFPAAVLVLDHKVEESDTRDAIRRNVAALDLARAIYGRIITMLADLDRLEASRTKPPPTAQLSEVLAPIRAGDYSSVANLRLSDGGYEKQVLDTVFGLPPVVRGAGAVFDPRDQNRLLANLELLTALRDSGEIQAGTMDQIVLERYLRALTDEMQQRREADEAWAKFARWLEVFGALLALAALMVIFPFGDAAAPALATALAVAGGAGVAVGIALMVNQALMDLIKAGKLEQDAADKLFRLGQDDPEAVVEIGQALAQSQALRYALAEGAFLAVLSLGAAHKVKMVARALNLQGFLADLQSVFSALEPSLADEEPDHHGG